MVNTKNGSSEKKQKPINIQKNEREEEGASVAKYDTNPLITTPIFSIVEKMSQAEIEKLSICKKCDEIAPVFEDSELMSTFDAFLNNGMNISETARILYMHRNTLMYRLNKLKKMTGLDIKMFDDAVTFAFMRLVYTKRGKFSANK
jgi:DNA-binding PucR family transcriptional regulator